MSHKYLTDLGIEESNLPWNWNPSDERQPKWKDHQEKYGFDERDTWSLDYTLVLLCYERLKYFREAAPISMDDPEKSHEYEIEGEWFTLGTLIDRILKGFEDYLKSGESVYSPAVYKGLQENWMLLGKIMPSLWW